MSERNEKLSAYLDDALHSDEVMSFSLSGEPDDARVVQRYQAIGQAMRSELGRSDFIDVSAAVREALSDENIASENTPASTPAEDDDRASEGLFGSWLTSLLRPAAGLAVAASVAVVMVTTLSQQGDEAASTALAPVADNSQPAATRTVAAPVADPVMSVPVSTRSTAPAQLDPYISQHLDHATRNSVQGRLPYARSAIYGNQRANEFGTDKKAIPAVDGSLVEPLQR